MCKKRYTDGTLIRAEEGPKVLASPLTPYMAQAFFILLWRFTLQVDTIGATEVIFEFLPRTPLDFAKSPLVPKKN